MSIRLVADVLDCGLTDKGEVLVMIALANHSSDDGTAWPSVGTIARMARLTPRSVQRVLRALEERGYIKLVPGSGRGNTNRYRVIPFPEREDQPGLFPSEPTPKRNKKGDTHVAPDTVSPFQKGDTGDTLSGRKGDTGDTKGRHPCHPNRKEPSKEKGEARKRARPPSFDEDLGIRPEVEEGYREHRRAKKAPLTPRAMTLLCGELRKVKAAGRDPNDGLDHAMLAGWQGFRAEWFLRQVPQTQPPVHGGGGVVHPGARPGETYAQWARRMMAEPGVGS